MAGSTKHLPDMLSAFQQQMDELERLFRLERKGIRGEQENSPPVDCFETADQYVVEIELPDFCCEDLNVGMYARNLLVINGFKREEEKKETVNYICVERVFGRFCRTVEIPPTVDVSKVKARYTNGVLCITFPKVAETGGIIKEIPIEQGE